MPVWHKIICPGTSTQNASLKHLTVLFGLIGLTINYQHVDFWIHIFLFNGSITWKKPQLSIWQTLARCPWQAAADTNQGASPAQREFRLLAWHFLSHPTPAASQSYTKDFPRLKSRREECPRLWAIILAAEVPWDAHVLLDCQKSVSKMLVTFKPTNLFFACMAHQWGESGSFCPMLCALDNISLQKRSHFGRVQYDQNWTSVAFWILPSLQEARICLMV